MQRASDITIAAFKAAFATLARGDDPVRARRQHAGRAQRRVGGDRSVGARGVREVFRLSPRQRAAAAAREGDIVLLDAGCALEGYQSDITRTTVFGKPTARQTEIWNLERRAQDAAFAAARVGATCESVDAAAQKGDHRRRLRPRLPGARDCPTARATASAWTATSGQLRPRQHAPARAGDVLQRRADDRDLWRVRHPAGGLPLHHEEGPRFFSKQSAAIDQPFG